jgi:hypothetical protein
LKVVLVCVAAALVASASAPGSASAAGTTIDGYNVEAAAGTFAECGSVNEEDSDNPPPATGNGAFDNSFSIAPETQTAVCSDGSSQDSTSGDIRSTGSIEAKTGALTLSQASEGTTTAISKYTGNPQTGECVDVGSGVNTSTTVKFTTETQLPFTFSGNLAGTETEKAHYKLVRTSAPAATIFDDSSGLSPSVVGILQPGEYEYRSSAIASNDLACTLTATKTDDFSYSFKLSLSPDTDGDGLPDNWETEGLDINGDGEPDLELPAMGADPERKDIFLEIDPMPGDEISQAAVNMVVQAFANAPVSNPDGSTGITVHVDNGPSSTMDPTTGETWGSLSRQDAVPLQQVLGTEPGGQYNWSAFEAIKKAHFEPARERAFHYVVSAERYGSSEQLSTGISRGIGASDLIIAHPLGPSKTYEGAIAEAGTLMHELGHNLGLHHGGTDDLNYKPTYLSIMNYAFQFTGLRRFAGSSRIDYARFGLSVNESALDEEQGFGAPAGSEAASFITLGVCPDGSKKSWLLRAGPLDFNCDGSIGGLLGSNVSSDINGDGQQTVLPAVSDWPHLVYAGGAVGAAGAVALPSRTAETEPPVSELREDQEVLESFGRVPTPPQSSAPAPAPRCTLRTKGRPKHGRLRVRATCDQAARLTLAGLIKITSRGAKGHPRKSRRLKVKALGASAAAGVPLTMTVKLPKAALIARKRGAKESILLTLTAANVNGTGTETARLQG